MGFIAPFVPYIVQGAGALYGAIKGHKKAKAAEQERGTALSGAQQVAGNEAASGSSMVTQGQQTQQPATNYYSTLLSGNRAAAAQATAAPRAAITDLYRGADRGLEQSGVQGAQRDVAKGELNRQRVGQLSSLVTGVQPGAASALTSIGEQQTATGANMQAHAGSLYGGLLGQGSTNQQNVNAENERGGQGAGGFIFDVLHGVAQSKFGGKAPLASRQTTPNVSSWMPA